MSTEIRSFKRVKRKVKTSQNPLFEKWLKEWKDEAASKGSDMQYCFSKALKSLQKFPVKLHSGKECMLLENFGAKLCQKLDDKLEAYKASHPEDVSVCRNEENKQSLDDEEFTEVVKKRKSLEAPLTKKRKTVTENLGENGKIRSLSYVPGYRSGGYAILVAMYEKSKENDFKGYLTKAEIENEAQDLCDSSFKKPPPGSHYTAWSSMGVLVRKKLVTKEGKPVRFSLTEAGIELAIKLIQVGDGLNNIENNVESSNTQSVPEVTQKVVPSITVEKKETKRSPQKSRKELLSQGSDSEPASEADETVFMLPGTFEIVLLVDTQERDEKFQQANNMTMRQLKTRNVNFEIRHLKVGDFIWIARDLRSGCELVLPYIVERKRYDDLASSIKDGRFHEQKFRLKQSGIENLIYLVEKYGNENQRLGLPLPTLHQAMANTQIVDGFTVRVTNNHDHSMRYLYCMTIQLNNLFKTKTLMSCKKSNLSPLNLSDDLISLMTFKDFNKGSEKNKKPTVRNMLVKQLVQLNGVSLEKAQAIVQLFPTPKALMEGLQRPSGEKTIADITFGGFVRSIGPVTAKHIHMLYTCLELK